MTGTDDAPRGQWSDTPPTGDRPAAPSGHAPSTAQPAAPGFDAQAYLQSLPEDERAAKATLPPHVLERDSKRQMLRSDYDRKRGEEAGLVREVVAQNKLLSQQVTTLMTTKEQAPSEPAPSLEELGKAVYDADSPEEYAKGIMQLVGQAVGPAVNQALEANPALRQVKAGVTLQQSRGSAGDGVEQADFDLAVKSLGKRLALVGASIGDLDEAALEFSLQPELELAKLQRLAQRGGTPGDTPPNQPAAPGNQAPTLPVAGSGASLGVGGGMGTPVTPFGPKSTLTDRVAATMRKHGLSQADLERMAKTF